MCSSIQVEEGCNKTPLNDVALFYNSKDFNKNQTVCIRDGLEV